MFIYIYIYINSLHWHTILLTALKTGGIYIFFVIWTDTKGLIATDMVTMKFLVFYNRNKDIK